MQNINIKKTTYKFLFLLQYLWMIPFLISVHTAPLPTFHSEIAVVFILATILLYLGIYLYFNKNNNNLNKNLNTNYAPLYQGLAAFLVYLCIQTFFLNNIDNIVVFDGQIWMIIFIFISLSAVIAANLYQKKHWQTKFFITILNVLIVLGLVQGILLCIQFFGWERSLTNDWRWLSQASKLTQSYRPFANLNQPNHTSTVMAWSVLAFFIRHILFVTHANIYAKKNYLLKNTCFYVISIFLLSAWILPASRTALAQLAALGLLLVFLMMMILAQNVFYFKNIKIQKNIYFSPLLSSLAIFINYAFMFGLLMYLLHQLSEYYQLKNVVTLWSRVFTPYENIAYAKLDMRGLLHQQGLWMFQNNPIFGVGQAGFAWQQFLAIKYFSFSEFANSSHQLLIDCLAKFGAVGSAILAYTFLNYVYLQLSNLWNLFKNININKNINAAENIKLQQKAWLNILMIVFSLAFLGIFFIHGLLEYPQNYLFFLVFLVFVLSALFNDSIYKINKNKNIIKNNDNKNNINKNNINKNNEILISILILSITIICAAFFTIYDYEKLNNNKINNNNDNILKTVLFQSVENYQNSHQNYLKNKAFLFLENKKDLNARDEQKCKTYAKQQQQALYFFVNQKIMQTYIISLICQNSSNSAFSTEAEKAFEYTQNMQKYFYTDKNWQNNLAKEMSKYPAERFVNFRKRLVK